LLAPARVSVAPWSPPRRRRSRLDPVRTNWFIAAVVLGIVAIVIAAIAMRLS
jgi:hypothetical protein